MAKKNPEVDIIVPIPWVHHTLSALMHFLCILYFRMKIIGRDKLPDEGPVLVISNHVCHLDPPMMGMLFTKRLPQVMGKKDLWKSKALAFAMNNLGGFPVDRDGTDRRAVVKSIRVLREGGVLAMFPEGTRSVDGELQEFLPGAGRMALSVKGTKVLPLRIDGGHEAWPVGQKLPKPRKIIVRIGDPFDPTELEDLPTDKKALYEAVSKEMYNRIKNI